MSPEIEQVAETIRSKQDFERFLHLLLRDCHESGGAWENASLPDYLAALSGFVRDLEGFYLSRNESFDLSQPTWKTFAHALLAARVYE
jgi:hypothetical protein